MLLSTQQVNQLSLVALQAASLAGQYIETIINVNGNRSQLTTHFKDSGSSLSSQVVTDVDFHSQALIIDHLTASCEQYDLALLSEENCADIAINEHPRFYKDYFWCIDPLDGTLPFIQGLDGYAVSIALVAKSGKPILSALYLPATATSYHTQIDNRGNINVFKNGKSIQPEPNDNVDTLDFYCDRSFLNSPSYPLLVNQLNKLVKRRNLQSLNIISLHGAVVNAAYVLESAVAVYIKLPKQQQGGGALWDFSATNLIAEGLLGWSSDIHGTALNLNQADSYYMNQKGIIYASDKTLALEVIALCKALV